jgi:transcriptional regulator with XRE-family HTH domain
MLETLREATTL